MSYEVDEYGNPINASNPKPVQLTGRNVKEKIAHNGIAIIDTANYDQVVDVSDMERKSIFIVNLLNQQVTVTVYAMSQTGSFSVTLGTKTVAASTSGVITSSDSGMAALAEPCQRLKIRIAAAVAPTSGTITSYVEGSQP